MSNEQSYIKTLVEAWEEVHKKGQLTLWILLAVKDDPKHMAQIKSFILDSTDGSLSADDQSMYRALRRLHDAEMVEFTETPSHRGGPDKKVYSLTSIGQKVLHNFLERNITNVYYKPGVRELIEKGI